MKICFLIFLVFLEINYCNSQGIETISVIPNLTAPLNVRIGNGYSFDEPTSEKILFSRLPEGFIETNKKTGVNIEYYFIRDYASLRNSLTLNAAVTYKSIGSKFESTLGLNSESIQSNDSYTLCLMVNSTNRVSSLKSNPDLNHLDPVAKSKIKLKNFTKRFGEYYINSIVYGAKIYVFLTMTSLTKDEKRELNATAGIKYSSLSAQAGLSKVFANTVRSGRVSATLKQFGFNSGEVSAATYLTYDANENIDSFFRRTTASLLGAILSDSEHAVPVAFSLNKVSNVLDVNDHEINVSEEYMSRYFNDYYKYQGDLNKIDRIRKKLIESQSDPEEVDMLTKLTSPLLDEMGILDRLNKECFLSAGKCKYYEPKTIVERSNIFNKYEIMYFPYESFPYPGNMSLVPPSDIIDCKWYEIPDKKLQYIRGQNLLIKIDGKLRSGLNECTNPRMRLRLEIYGVISESNVSILFSRDYTLVESAEIKLFSIAEKVKVPDNAVGMRVMLKLWESGCTGLPNDIPLIPSDFNVIFTNPVNHDIVPFSALFKVNNGILPSSALFNENAFLTERCIKELFAAPSTWGPEKTIHECFGDDRSCKFETIETSGDTPIRYQISKNDGAWEEYREGDLIHGQKVKARAQSASVSGNIVKILVQSNCPCN